MSDTLIVSLTPNIQPERNQETNVRYALGTSDQVQFSTIRGSEWPRLNSISEGGDLAIRYREWY
jgi:hypothetical protein